MRKMPKVALAATAVLALGLVFAAGSASASTSARFCKSAPLSHICPEADAYKAGTEISASLNGVATFSSGGTTVGQCTGSTQLMSLTNEPLGGGEGGGVFKQFSFSGCEGVSVTFGGGGFETVGWLEGTHNGVIHNWGFLEIHQTGVTCRYLLDPSVGEGITGGSNATIVANSPNNMTKIFEGSSFVCPVHETLTGTWTVTSPSPLYVEKA